MSRYPIGFLSAEGAVDYLEVDSCGILRVHGWYHYFVEDRSTCPLLQLNGKELVLTKRFKVHREDVKVALNSSKYFHGIVFEFILSEHLMREEERAIEVYWEDSCILSVNDATGMQAPAYPYLLNDERIFHRDWIYCSGLPVDYLNPEILSIAKTLPGPILDLGCGTGVLLDALRSFGKECSGLELDQTEIRNSIPEERSEFIKFYSGTLPLPFENNSFESVVLSEVLEHLPEPEAVLADIARICKHSLLVTVPDLSSIPLNHKNEVVPWHLLESTHVNFFNANSLELFLKQWFPRIELYRIGLTVTNDTQWWGGLMAVARR